MTLKTDATTAPAADSQVTPAAGTTNEPVITREQTTVEKIEADNAELDGELQKVLDKAKTGNERAEKGKFAKLPAAPVQSGEDKDPAKEQAKDGKEAKADAKAETEKPTAPAVKPPQSWSAEMKEKFSKYTPEEQQFFAKREAEAHRAISELGQRAKAMQPVSNTLEKYRGSFEKNGVTFEQGIENLVKASDMLDQNPKEAIRRLAQTYNVDVFDLIDTNTGRTADPAVSALQEQVSALQRELADSRRERETRTRSEQESKVQSFVGIIDEFARDKPDFDDLETEILGSIEAVRTANPHLTAKDILQKAYEMAQWANPSTRQKLLEKTEKERMEKARKEADAAKRASSINVRGAHQPVSDDDLDEELHGVLRKHRV